MDRASSKTKVEQMLFLPVRWGLSQVLKISKLSLLQESKFKETGVITPEEVSRNFEIHFESNDKFY